MQAIKELEKALEHLVKAHELLSEQTPKSGEEAPEYKTGWAIHWTKHAIRKLKWQEKK